MPSLHTPRFDPAIAGLDTGDPSTIHSQPSTLPLRRPSKLLRFPGLPAIPYQQYRNAGGAYYTLFYYAGGKRRRESRSTFSALKKRAKQIATDIANGQTAMSEFTEADRASHLRVCELCPPGYQPELAISIFADIVNKLGDVSPQEAVKFFLENRPKGYVPKPLPELVTLFLEEKEPDISEGWYNALSVPLERLSSSFSKPFHLVTSAELNTWLRGLKSNAGAVLGARARHNHRAAVEQLARWAQANGHLPRTWSELEHVPDPGAKVEGDIHILTPEQMLALLSRRQHAEETGRAKKSLIPFLALQAFAGIRHEEICPGMDPDKIPLDWRDIHLAERHVYVPKAAAKTGRDRIVPISDNLAAWLEPYARRNGSLCPLAEPGNALTTAKRAAGIPAGRNETKNCLRKSFISYRKALVKNVAQVADEAGNSPGIIRKHYCRVIPESEAKRWFDLWPTAAGVLQLNFAGM